MSHASYMIEQFYPEMFEDAVNGVCKLIEEKFPDVDYIAASGISGVPITGAICYKTKKNLFIVRKAIDDTHSRVYSSGTTIGGEPKLSEYNNDIGKDGQKTAIIIDDLISSGTTAKRIVDAIEKEGIKVLAIILYHETGYIGEKLGSKGLNFPIYSIDASID